MQIAISSYTATSCLGNGTGSITESIRNRQSGLRYNDFEGCDLDTWIGRVEGVESVVLPDELADLESRNNQLTLLGLQKHLPSGRTIQKEEVSFEQQSNDYPYKKPKT